MKVELDDLLIRVNVNWQMVRLSKSMKLQTKWLTIKLNQKISSNFDYSKSATPRHLREWWKAIMASFQNRPRSVLCRICWVTYNGLIRVRDIADQLLRTFSKSSCLSQSSRSMLLWDATYFILSMPWPSGVASLEILIFLEHQIATPNLVYC